MAEEDAEDVECVVPVVCEREGVDEGVVVDYGEHGGDGWEGYDESGGLLFDDTGTEDRGKEAIRDRDVEEIRVEQRDGEEDYVGPYVKHLGKVDGDDVILFVTCKYSLVGVSRYGGW